MFYSIRWRLVASFTFLTLLVISVVGGLVVRITSDILYNRELADLQANAESIAQQALPLMVPNRAPDRLRQFVETVALLSDVRVRILDSRGSLLADSGLPNDLDNPVLVTPFGAEWFLERPGAPLGLMVLSNDPLFFERHTAYIEEIAPGVSMTVISRDAGWWGNRIEFRTAPESELSVERTATTAGGLPVDLTESTRSELRVLAPIGNPSDPAGQVELSAGPGYGQRALDTVWRALLLAAAGGVLVSIVAGLWLSRRLTSPLSSLTETARQMGAGDLSIRAPAVSKDEIGVLARQFNSMARRLEASFQSLAGERDALRRFIADASHELRTPITALKNFNALLQQEAGQDSAVREEFLRESQVQIERLEWITANLLDLSRLQAGLVEFQMEPHPVAELIRSAVSAFEPVASQKGIALHTAPVDEQVTLHCDRDRMLMALTNLLDNAIKYTGSGGRIEVGVAEEAGCLHIWVQDSGSGIAKQDLPHIWERFYRGSAAGESGAGLGLAIARQIIAAMGGEVGAESQPGSGSRFTLSFRAGEP